MSFIAEFWPLIVASVSGAVVWFSRMQTKNAKQEAESAKERIAVQQEFHKAFKAQIQSTKDGEVLAEKIMEEAHDPNSAGDLTNSDY